MQTNSSVDRKQQGALQWSCTGGHSSYCNSQRLCTLFWGKIIHFRARTLTSHRALNIHQNTVCMPLCSVSQSRVGVHKNGGWRPFSGTLGLLFLLNQVKHSNNVPIKACSYLQFCSFTCFRKQMTVEKATTHRKQMKSFNYTGRFDYLFVARILKRAYVNCGIV